MKFIYRNNKYYLQCIDGEIGFSKKEYEEYQDRMNELSRIFEKSLEYSEGKNWKIGDVPQNLNDIVKIDIFCEDLLKSFELMIKKGADTITLMTMIDALIAEVNSSIKNPILNQEKGRNKYLKSRLKAIRPFIIRTNFKIVDKPSSVSKNEKTNYKAKHFVLTYLIECQATGIDYPNGQKTKLEKIGNERMGAGKGNRFYKVFNELVNKDLNSEKILIEIAGKNWRKIVKDLSKEPAKIETYLKSVQL